MKIYIRSLVAAAAIIGAAPVCAVHAEGTEVVAPGETETPEIEWIEVSLESAGSLGVEVLYKVDKLKDVVNLRVSGPMNDQDWATLSNMSAVNIDLSGATSGNMPSNVFESKTNLRTFLFPQGVTSIGEKAFYRSGLTEVEIPATVRSVGSNCFCYCPNLVNVDWKATANISDYCFYGSKQLASVTIADGASSIGQYSFKDCTKLAEIFLPATLNKIDYEAFYNCEQLAEVIFPESLTTIGTRAFYSCNLTKLILPDSVTLLNGSAFANNRQLAEVVLPVGISTYKSGEFADCNNITKVTCRAATPPSALSGSGNTYPFSMSKAKCTLIVPDFAVVDYKLDDYWHNFGTIEGGVQSDSWTIASNLSLTNDRRMDGTPSVTLKNTGRLTVGGSAPMPMNDFMVYMDLRSGNNNYGQLINSSPAMSAQSGRLRLYTYSGYWYFITMPCDVQMSQVRHLSSGSFVFRYYDGESRAANGFGVSWKNVAADGVLEAGKAYIYQTNKEGTIEMELENTGLESMLSNAHRVTPVNAWQSESSANSGWNLVGNPWLSYYDLYYSGLTCPVTLWDENNRKYIAYSLIDDNVVLKPTQAFFMQQADADGELTFDIKGRQFTSQVARPQAVAAKNADKGGRSIFNIEIAGSRSVSEDRMRIVLNEEASEEYEPARDAAKFFAEDGASAELFSVDADGNFLSISERPTTNGSIPMGVYLPQTGKYVVKATRTDGEAKLYDSLTGKYADLGEGEEYSFEAAEQGFCLDRFHLMLKPVESSILEMEAEQMSNKVIYTLDGHKMASNADLAPGIYIEKQGNKVSKRIVR